MRPGSEGLVRALPLVLSRRFDPRAASGLDAAFELRVGDALLGIRVAEDRCTVTRGPCPESRAQVTIAPRDLVALALRERSWPQLLSAGRLRLTGDPFLALRFPPLFGLR